MSGSAGFGARKAGFVALRKRVPEKITGYLKGSFKGFLKGIYEGSRRGLRLRV